MGDQLPRVSIGVPVYNGEGFISQTLDSLLGQTFTDFEIIISDNASSDRTGEICERYAARDSRIRYTRSEQNLGAAWNFNRVVQLARGEYFHWHAHDDLIQPTFLEKTLAVLEQQPEVVLCSTQVDIINDKGEWMEAHAIPLKTNAPRARERFRSLLIDYHLCYEVFGLIRMAALRQTPLIGNYGHGDGILLEYLGLLGPFYEIPEALFLARAHARQSMNLYGGAAGVGGKKKDNNYHAYTLWFDPSKAGKIIFPTWRILVEHFKALWFSRLSLGDRFYCLFFLLYWTARRRRPLLKDLWIGIQQWVGRMTLASSVKPSPAHSEGTGRSGRTGQ